MITGNKRCKIKRYLPIDHIAEGFGYVKPEEGEEIWGIPYQRHSELSWPFIEHRKDGKVVKIINSLDVSEIVFE